MLVVYYLDDEPMLCSLFRDIFSSTDIEITTFNDATDAIAACAKTAPDLFFIDMTLADTTGDKVALAVDESIFKVRVTGDLDSKTAHLFQADFGKPFDMPAIQSLLDSKLDAKQ